MSSNEAHEHFRDRIGEFLWSCHLAAQADQEQFMTWEQLKQQAPASAERIKTWGAGVYGIALRDFVNMYGDWRYAEDSLTLADSITIWADDALGIDLTDTEAQ